MIVVMENEFCHEADRKGDQMAGRLLKRVLLGIGILILLFVLFICGTMLWMKADPDGVDEAFDDLKETVQEELQEEE